MALKTWESDLVTIKVDYDKCKEHGDCVDSCPGEIYELKDGKTVPANINGCVEVCPENAIDHSSCE
ncbi:4Fe-4S ferredoxin [Thermodesulfobacteriota bacterium]